MKKHLLLLVAICATTFAFAAKIYVNPGHGTWGSNDRNMATITHALGDTTGFYESNTNMWKCYYLREKLQKAGHTVVMSHTACGYSPELSTVAAEAQRSGANYFISVHSNANADGDKVNYPAYFYRGTTGNDYSSGSINRINTAWPYSFDIHHQGMEHNSSYSLTKVGLYADITFWSGKSSTTTIDGVSYTGYYGVLRHGIPGYLIEGYFHTYQPARHRALNPDWCRQEGLRHYRGIAAWYGTAAETKGYIMGYVRTKEKEINQTNYTGRAGNDIYMPINGAKVYLTNSAGDTIKTDCYHYVARMKTNQKYYTTDNNYNGVFVFEDLTPGTYTITVRANGYKKYTQNITVTADKTSYTEVFMTSGTDTEEEDNNTTDPTPTPDGSTDPGFDGTEAANATGLNPYAYGLSSELSADNTELTLRWWLNAPATNVKIVFNDGEKDYVVRDYNNVAVDGYKTVIQTSTLPCAKRLTWRVDVTGAGFTNATKIGKEYYFFRPSSVDTDDNPESPYFGRLLCTEAYHEIKGKSGTGSNGAFSGYQSYNLGAAIYEYDAKFDFVKGHNGGNTFETYRKDVTTQKSSAPHRVRIADDGRVFATSFNGGEAWGGKVMWQVDAATLDTWTPAFGYGYINTTTSNLVTNDGYYIAAPNIGFDVQGGGANLRILMLSGTQACYSSTVSAFRCYEYAWGNKTSWSTAPTKKWFDGNTSNNCNGTYKVINHLGAQVQFDGHGGIWMCQYRGAADNTYPSLVYYDKNGTYRYHEVMNNRGGGGFRFNKDFTRVIISGGNGVTGEATVYTVSNDANGYPTKLTKEFTIAMGLGSGMLDFAWDYADNIYAISYSKEKLVAYALPHSNGRVVSTPAASKYAFTLPQRTYQVTATVNDATMGSVEGAGVYNEGATATLTATANAGYQFVNWTVDGKTLTDNPLTLTVNANVNAVANFAAIEHTVTATVNDATMGSVEGAGTYNEGATATLTATANAGYQFVSWTVGGETLTENPLSLTVTADIEVLATFAAIEHTVTVTVNDATMGSVAGAGVYNEGATATLTATANAGYQFVSWTVDGETLTDNPLSLLVDADKAVLATFAAIEHTVSVTVNDATMGSVEGAGTYNEGATATLTATANPGYQFVSWTVDGETLTDNPLTLTVDSDKAVLATFAAIEHTVTVTANDPAMGSVEGAGTYNEGATATLTATANPGYQFVSWTVDGETLTDNPLSLLVDADKTVLATFAAIEHTVTVTVNDSAMGSVEGAGTYNEGATATLTATPAAGHQFVNWTVGGETLTDNPLTLTVTGDITAVANFAVIEHTVTATVNDATMGSVEGAGVYNEGASATLTATANAGYQFVSWTVGGETLTENPLTLTVTADIEVLATFAAIEHTVTVTLNDPAMGSVEGAGVYNEGATATLTATANAGYQFVSWTVGGETLTENPLTLTVDADKAVLATFAAIEHTVSVTVNDATMGIVEGAGVYNEGATATLTATANAGYQFVSWTVDGETLTDNPLTLTVDADKAVLATFAAIEHTVSVTVNDATMGSVEGAGVYNEGATATLIATANAGYQFVSWTVGGETLTDNPLTLTDNPLSLLVDADKAVLATFAAIEHTVTATVNDPAMGSVEGAGTYNEGAIATLTATANAGYEFAYWVVGTDTLTANPLEVIVTADVVVEAVFAAIPVSQYTVTVEINDSTMGAVDGAGVYDEGTVVTLIATPNAGYEFLYWTVGEETLTDNPLTLTVDNDITVVATFKSILTTGTDNLENNTLIVEKVLRDGNVFIRINDQLYTLTGARVD